MKIVCVAYLHGSGGAERQIILLANSLAGQGHTVFLAVMAEKNICYEIDKRVIVVDLSPVEHESGNRIVNRYRALKCLYRDINPDVSIHYWLQSAYLSAFMKNCLPGKIIYSERGDPGDAEYSGALGLIRFVAFKRIAGFVFQSEGAKNFFGKGIQSRSTIIYNPVTVPENIKMCDFNEREKRIVTVGRLHPQKNQSLLIESFAKISESFPEYKLEIYGSGELKETLDEEIKSLGLGDKVFLLGSHRDIFERIYRARLFVLSSNYEGMPNALIEAMSLHIPCISTDCKPGGAREIINDGENGFIVPCNDSEALANAMITLLSDSLLSQKFSEKTGDKLGKFSDEFVFNQWNSFIADIVKGKNK